MDIYWIEAQAPRRVLALAKHLGVSARFVHLDLNGGDLRAPEFVRLNPNRKAPVLVDGDTVLWESSAIMAYLCVKARSDMWPAHDPAEQVEVLRWLSWNDQHWAPAVAPFYFEYIVKATFGGGAPDHLGLKAKVPALAKVAQILEAHLTDREFVACRRLTIADFQLASMATYWRRSDMPLAAFANIVRWLDGLDRIPAWAHPWPAGSHGT